MIMLYVICILLGMGLGLMVAYWTIIYYNSHKVKSSPSDEGYCVHIVICDKSESNIVIKGLTYKEASKLVEKARYDISIKEDYVHIYLKNKPFNYVINPYYIKTMYVSHN